MADNDDINSRKDKKDINKRSSSAMRPYVEAVDKFEHRVRRETKEIRDLKRRSEKAEKAYEEAQKQYSRDWNKALVAQNNPEEEFNLEASEERLKKAREKDLRISTDYSHASTEDFIMQREKLEGQVNTLAKRDFSLRSLPPQMQAQTMHRAKLLVEGGLINEGRIAQNREKLSEKIDKQREGVIGSFEQDDDTGALLKRASKLEKTKERAVTLEAAEKVMKTMGLDSASIYKRGEAKRDSILAYRDDMALQKRVERGQTGSIKSEESKLEILMDKFEKAHEKFIGALDDSPEALEAFKKSVIDAGKSMDEQKKLVDEMNRQGKGGGASFIYKMNAMAGMARGAYELAGTYSNATVTAENQNINLRAEYARAISQEFNTKFAATQGDMTALTMLQMGAFDKGTTLGSEQRAQSTSATSVQATAGVGEAIAEGAKGFYHGSKTAGKVGAGIGLFGGMLSGSQKAANSVIDLNYRLSAAQAELGGRNAMVNLAGASSEVLGNLRQKYYDMSMGNLEASQGFGSQRGQIFDEMRVGAITLGGKYGATVQEQQAAYQTALMSSGADFTRKGAAGMGQTIDRAFEVGMSGVTSTQDYLSRIGQMSQVGGGDKEIEDILANAVARGVDNAKSFGDLADSIASLSSGSASGGINVAGVTASAMLAGMDNMRGNGVNERLNLNAMQKQMQAIDEITSNTGLTAANQLSDQFVSENMPYLGPRERERAMAMSLREAKSVKSMIDEGKIQEAKTTSQRLGTYGMFFDEEGSVRKGGADKAIENEYIQLAGSMMAEMPYEAAMLAVKGDIKGAAKISKKTEAEVYAITSSYMGGSEAAKGLYDNSFEKKELQKSQGEVSSAQQAKIISANQESQAREAGASSIGGMGGVVASMEKIASTLDPLKTIADSIGAASNMKLDTKAFNDTVSRLDTVISKAEGLLSRLASGEIGKSSEPPVYLKDKDGRMLQRRGQPIKSNE